MPKNSKPKPPRIDVMVSSTVRDLKDHRAATRDAILQAGISQLRMEEAGARTGTNAVHFSRDLASAYEEKIIAFIEDREAEQRERKKKGS